MSMRLKRATIKIVIPGSFDLGINYTFLFNTECSRILLGLLGVGRLIEEEGDSSIWCCANVANNAAEIEGSPGYPSSRKAECGT